MQPSSMSTHEATARARVYGFLAQVLSAHPNRESIRGVSRLAEDLGISRPGDASLSALDQEYMELFVVPGARYVAPYESVFRDRWLLPAVLRPGSNPAETGPMIKGLVMGESTDQVRQCYVRQACSPMKSFQTTSATSSASSPISGDAKRKSGERRRDGSPIYERHFGETTSCNGSARFSLAFRRTTGSATIAPPSRSQPSCSRATQGAPIGIPTFRRTTPRSAGNLSPAPETRHRLQRQSTAVART